MHSSNLRPLVFIGLVLTALLAMPSHGQLVVEDLPLEEQLVSDEIEQVFASANELFDTIDQAESIPLYTRVIDELRPMSITGDERVVELLRTSLVQRAQANYNFGETDAAQADIETLVRLAPGYEIDRDAASERIVRMFDTVRERLVGYAEFLVDPVDAKVRIDGATVPTDSGPVPILAGSYTATVDRPGHQSTETEFEVKADRSSTVEVALERTSAVLMLHTRPPGATVYVNGREALRTEGTAGAEFVPDGQAAAYDRAEFSDIAYIEDLQPGRTEVEVRMPGYRSFSTAVDIDGMVDVPIGAVVLEQQAGTLALRDLPTDAEVRIDQEVARPQRGARGLAEIPLAPGNYRVSISQGVFGRFETNVEIADARATEVVVELRPALVTLGVLGGDEVASRKLSSAIADTFQSKREWALLDHSAAAAPLLSELALSARRLRQLVAGNAEAKVDWASVQEAFDRSLPGSVYVLGVLSDDLLAAEASLWIWPAAPGPAQPELRIVRLDENDPLAEIGGAFQPELSPIRPTFGGSVIDTPVAPGPVLVDVVPGRPAANAGLMPGDAITALNGVPVYSAALFFDALIDTEVGDTVTLEIVRAGETMNAELVTEPSFTVIDLSDPTRLAAPVAAAVAAELQSESEWPRWVLKLNQARILLNAGDAEAAVRELREIDRAQVPGVDQVGLGPGTIDYWLGFALERAGPRYLDRAREAYERAAAAPDARFLHDDGPRIAPRAWARLQRLAPQP